MGSGLVIVFEGGPSGLLGKTQRASTNLWVSVPLTSASLFSSRTSRLKSGGHKSEMKVTNFIIHNMSYTFMVFRSPWHWSAPHADSILPTGILGFTVGLFLHIFWDAFWPNWWPSSTSARRPRFRLLWPTKILCLALATVRCIVYTGGQVPLGCKWLGISTKTLDTSWKFLKNHHLKSYPLHCPSLQSCLTSSKAQAG